MMFQQNSVLCISPWAPSASGPVCKSCSFPPEASLSYQWSEESPVIEKYPRLCLCRKLERNGKEGEHKTSKKDVIVIECQGYTPFWFSPQYFSLNGYYAGLPKYKKPVKLRSVRYEPCYSAGRSTPTCECKSSRRKHSLLGHRPSCVYKPLSKVGSDARALWGIPRALVLSGHWSRKELDG